MNLSNYIYFTVSADFTDFNSKEQQTNSILSPDILMVKSNPHHYFMSTYHKALELTTSSL